MAASSITLPATLQPDGMTLQLDKKVSLPPGPVTVTLELVSLPQGPEMLEVLDRIHHDQQRRGRRPITEAEMAAELHQLRAEDDEYEKHWQQVWSQSPAKPTKTDNP